MGKGSSAKKAAAAAQQTANTQADNILATNAASNQPLQTQASFYNQAQSPLAQLLGLGGADTQAGYDAVTNDAGYKYGLNEAIRGADASAAARGSLLSGASMLNAADLSNRYYADARNNAINTYLGMIGQGSGLLSNIANNNNAAAGNAANLRVGGANQYAQQRAQAYQNNFNLGSGLLNKALDTAASAAGSFGF